MEVSALLNPLRACLSLQHFLASKWQNSKKQQKQNKGEKRLWEWKERHGTEGDVKSSGMSWGRNENEQRNTQEGRRETEVNLHCCSPVCLCPPGPDPRHLDGLGLVHSQHRAQRVFSAFMPALNCLWRDKKKGTSPYIFLTSIKSSKAVSPFFFFFFFFFFFLLLSSFFHFPFSVL